MGKLKIIEKIVGDVEVGDLVMLKIKERNNEFVGYCCLIRHCKGGKNSFNKSDYIEPESYSYEFRNSLKKTKWVDEFIYAESSLWVYPKKRKGEINLSDSGTNGKDLRVNGYEVLRRAKK